MAANHDSRSPSLVFSYDGMEPDDELLQWIRDGQVTGIVIFSDNAVDKQKLTDSIRILRATAPGAIRVMIDEEGGKVCRLPHGAESMRALRDYETQPMDTLSAAYHGVAQRLQRIGFDVLLAPVVDIGAPEAEWIHERTFSDSADAVVTMVRAVVPAIQNVGIASCAKHYPGSRTVRTDTHHGFAVSTCSIDEWQRTDALPFAASIESGVAMIMVGHQQMDQWDRGQPACMSRRIVTEILRDQLGFSGRIVTDDLAMHAISKQYPMEQAVAATLEAGCDDLLVCRNRDLQRRALTGFQEWLATHPRSDSR